MTKCPSCGGTGCDLCHDMGRVRWRTAARWWRARCEEAGAAADIYAEALGDIRCDWTDPRDRIREAFKAADPAHCTICGAELVKFRVWSDTAQGYLCEAHVQQPGEAWPVYEQRLLRASEAAPPSPEALPEAADGN